MHTKEKHENDLNTKDGRFFTAAGLILSVRKKVV